MTTDGELVSLADVGFGVSQVLPVLVALITAKKDQMVYVEQPEIHLHPRAQLRFARLLCDAALRGVLLVIETHSSILMRGIQTQIANSKISNKEVSLNWFSQRKDGTTRIDIAHLDEAGSFGNWPEDFDSVALNAEAAYLDAVEKHFA